MQRLLEAEQLLGNNTTWRTSEKGEGAKMDARSAIFNFDE